MAMAISGQTGDFYGIIQYYTFNFDGVFLLYL